MPVRKTAYFIMTETLNSEDLLIDNETGELLNGISGAEIQFLKDFGCGIDCHARCLQISVLVRRDQSIYEYRNQFDTDWDSVVKARDWVLSVLETRASPPVDVSEGLHYCIESTSSYHVVVCKAWGGKPTVPHSICFPLRRKAYHHKNGHLPVL